MLIGKPRIEQVAEGVRVRLAQEDILVPGIVEEGHLLKPPGFFGGLPGIDPDFSAVFGLEELDVRVVPGEDGLEMLFGHSSLFMICGGFRWI